MGHLKLRTKPLSTARRIGVKDSRLKESGVTTLYLVVLVNPEKTQMSVSTKTDFVNGYIIK